MIAVLAGRRGKGLNYVVISTGFIVEGFSKLYLDFLFKVFLDFPCFSKEDGTFIKFEMQNY